MSPDYGDLRDRVERARNQTLDPSQMMYLVNALWRAVRELREELEKYNG